MKTKLEPIPQQEPKQQPEVSTAIATVEPVTVNDLFKRSVNAVGPIRTLKLRRVLTRPMVTMAKLKQLAVICQSEIFTMDLPNKSRKGGMSKAVVFNAKQLTPTENGFIEGAEVIVACHAIMSRAIGDAGFSTIVRTEDAEGNDVIVETQGRQLTGVILAFMSGDIEDGKRYRSISVAELE